MVPSKKWWWWWWWLWRGRGKKAATGNSTSTSSRSSSGTTTATSTNSCPGLCCEEGQYFQTRKYVCDSHLHAAVAVTALAGRTRQAESRPASGRGQGRLGEGRPLDEAGDTRRRSAPWASRGWTGGVTGGGQWAGKAARPEERVRGEREELRWAIVSKMGR